MTVRKKIEKVEEVRDLPKPKGSSKARLRAARLLAVQALYQTEITGSAYAAVTADLLSKWAVEEIEGQRYVTPDEALFLELMQAAEERKADIETLIKEAAGSAVNIGRMEVLLKSILVIGTGELLTKRNTPQGVIINDYIEICKAFFGDREPALVNAILDRVGKGL